MEAIGSYRTNRLAVEALQKEDEEEKRSERKSKNWRNGSSCASSCWPPGSSHFQPQSKLKTHRLTDASSYY